MTCRRLLFCLVIVQIFSTWCSPSFSWEVRTHIPITAQATQSSILDRVIRESLGFNAGQTAVFKDGNDQLQARQWIEAGSDREDDFGFFSLRFANHFHQPLRSPWSQAGLNDVFSGQSSGIWAQTLNQSTFSGSGSWSWQETRDRFYRGLTSSNKTDRESFLAQTFRGLGHQMHLIQDASSVPHTRNEAHPASFWTWTIEQWGLQFQSTNPTRFAAILGQTPIMPNSQLLNLSPEPGALIPISKFLDANQYNGSNPGATTSLFNGTNASGQPALLSPFGLSEYTNANFVHRNTLFTDTLPQDHKWWSPYPRRSSTNIDTEIVPEVLTAEDGITDQVVYIKKERDGEQIDHFLKTTYAGIRSSELLGNSEPLAKILQLDDRVYEDYARLLWPRAVGYSTALLDYFFRGKLDVDLSTDPNDATVVRVEGTNASTEKLDGGTLELYGEDANGVRTAATAVGSTVVTADPGQPVLASFRLPANAEKLMAVYKGKLGNEIPQGTPGSADYFPGAVIGKLLGRERVEQIFTDFTRWYVRNPQGVFPLPVLKSEVDDLQWGDDSDMMVGRSRLGPGEANKFYSYRLNRQSGSTNIPLVTVSQPLPDNPTATQIVDMQQLQEFPFPMSMDSGTTIDFSHTLPYKQYLLWQNTLAEYNWIPTPSEGAPDAGHYEGSEQASYGISLLVDQTATGSFRVPIILDEASNVFGPGTANYFWNIWSIHLSADGRPLALIRVDLSTNNLGTATFPSRTLGKSGGDIGLHPELVDLPPVQVGFELPEIGSIWLLVDVATGRVIGNTAPQTLVVHHETARISYGPNPNQIDPPMRSMGAARFNGGPQSGTFVSGIDVVRPPHNSAEFQLCSDERLNTMNVIASQAVPSRFISNQLTLNRAEITQIEFPQPPNHPQRIINFPINCGSAQEPPTGFRVMVAPDPAFIPNTLDFGIVRTAPTGETEQLVLLLTQSQGQGSSDAKAKLATWNPTLSRIDHVSEFSERGFQFLLTASRDVAAAGTIGQNFQKSRIADLVANSIIEIPSLDIFDYLLLEPNYLYNMFDFKFHVKDGSFQSTGLPANLATTQTRRLGRYHVVAVR